MGFLRGGFCEILPLYVWAILSGFFVYFIVFFFEKTIVWLLYWKSILLLLQYCLLLLVVGWSHLFWHFQTIFTFAYLFAFVCFLLCVVTEVPDPLSLQSLPTQWPNTDFLKCVAPKGGVEGRNRFFKSSSRHCWVKSLQLKGWNEGKYLCLALRDLTDWLKHKTPKFWRTKSPVPTLVSASPSRNIVHCPQRIKGWGMGNDHWFVHKLPNSSFFLHQVLPRFF